MSMRQPQDKFTEEGRHEAAKRRPSALLMVFPALYLQQLLESEGNRRRTPVRKLISVKQSARH